MGKSFKNSGEKDESGISGLEVEEAIRRAIDEAWNHPDPEVKARQHALFSGTKPTVAEFIAVMCQQLEKENRG